MRCHPEYDPVEEVWFTGGLEARTLRELRVLLPAGSTIEGYYPRGYKNMPPWAGQRMNDTLRAPRVIIPRSPLATRKKAEAHDYNAILDLWAKGWTAPRIADKMGIRNWMVVGQVVCRWRDRGDPRAVSRGSAGGRRIRA